MTSKKIILRTFQSRWGVVLSLILSITVSGIIAGSIYTEALRRITQSIWDGNRSALTAAMLLLGAVILVNWGMVIIRRRSLFTLKKEMTFACEDTLYKQYQDYEYFNRQQQEDMLGAMRKTAPDTANSVLEQCTAAWQLFIVIVSGCIYGAWLNPLIMVLSLLITCVMVWGSRESTAQVAPLFQEFRDRNSKLYNLLWEQVKNREIAKYLIPDKVTSGYDRESADYLHVLLGIKKITNGAGLFSQFGSTALIIFVSLAGGIYVIKGSMSFAALLALITLIPTVASYLFQIPSQLQGWKTVQGNCNNLDILLERGREEMGAKYLGEEIREVSVSHLVFSYQPEKAVLQDISMEFRRGICYMVAGTSGCGKSTLIKLLAKLIPYEKGEIMVNAASLRELERGAYWKRIGYVAQEPVIVPGSLAYNIMMKDADEQDFKRLEEVAEAVGLQDYVKKHEKGMLTVLSEGELSKGEKMKIAVARVLYHKPEVLLLDEMTEGLDPKAELMILKALKNYVKKTNAVMIAISHRLEPLRQADTVIFMEDGRIAAVSDHDSLYENNAGYRMLVEAHA